MSAVDRNSPDFTIENDIAQNAPVARKDVDKKTEKLAINKIKANVENKESSSVSTSPISSPILGRVQKTQNSKAVEQTRVFKRATSAVSSKSSIIDFATKLPHDLATKFTDAIEKEATLPKDLKQCISIITKREPELLNEIHQYLLNTIQSLPNKEEARTLALYLSDQASLVGITEGSALAEEIKIIVALTDPNSTSAKNPYNLFEQLNTFRAQDRPQVSLPGHIVDGTKVTVTFPQKSEIAVSSLTYSQLPQHVSMEQLEEVFTAIEGKIAAENCAPGKSRLEEFIHKQTGKSFLKLKENFVGIGGYYLRELLRTADKKSDEVVPPDVERFFSIAKYILELSDEMATEGLTEKERTIIKMAATISDCPTGKKEDIVDAYNDLTQTGKIEPLGGKVVEGNNIVPKYMNEFYQHQLTKLLYSDAVLMDLTGAEQGNSVYQQTHQVLHAKNLIGHLIGLHHELTFDIGTGVLYDELARKKPAEVLQIFCNHFTPELLINALIDQYNTDRGTPRSQYDNFTKLVTEYLFLNKDMSADDVMDKCWDFDDDMKVTLTEFGARQILIATGYLSETDHSEE